MVGSMKGNGKIITCTGTVCTSGQMVESIAVSTSMIRNMGRVFISGRMDEGMMENGRTVSNMGMAAIFCPVANQSEVDGKMEQEPNGLDPQKKSPGLKLLHGRSKLLTHQHRQKLSKKLKMHPLQLWLNKKNKRQK